MADTGFTLKVTTTITRDQIVDLVVHPEELFGKIYIRYIAELKHLGITNPDDTSGNPIMGTLYPSEESFRSNVQDSNVVTIQTQNSLKEQNVTRKFDGYILLLQKEDLGA